MVSVRAMGCRISEIGRVGNFCATTRIDATELMVWLC